MKTNRKTFNHKEVANFISKKYNLVWYKSGNFIFFKDSETEIMYIELIPASKRYLYTIRAFVFGHIETSVSTDEILKDIEDLYLKQKHIIDSNKQGVNISLVLEGEKFYLNKII